MPCRLRQLVKYGDLAELDADHEIDKYHGRKQLIFASFHLLLRFAEATGEQERHYWQVRRQEASAAAADWRRGGPWAVSVRPGKITEKDDPTVDTGRRRHRASRAHLRD